MMPPTTRKAGTVMPKNLRIRSPNRAKAVKMPPENRAAVRQVRRRWAGSYLEVMAKKTGIFARGSITTNNVATAVTK
jgi:hypothetical protein